MPDTPMTVFISYSRANSNFVDRLEADLRVRDFHPWMDRRELEGGQDFLDEIQSAILRSQVLLVVLSPESVESKNVRMEYRQALRDNKLVIPLLYRPCERVPIDLNDIQWVDFTGGYDRGLRDLLVALATVVPVPASKRRTVPLPPVTPESIENEEADLVEARPAPPPPDPDLLSLYQASVKARAANDLERTAVYWQQIIDRDPGFGNHSVANQMPQLNEELRQQRIPRLRKAAQDATAKGDWRSAIGNWSALVGMDPDNLQAHWELLMAIRSRAEKACAEGLWGEEIGAWEALLKLEPQDKQATKRLRIAEQNQRCEWHYTTAKDFVRSGDLAAARIELQTLWNEAPYYGDPDHLATVAGIAVPPSREEVQAQQRAAETADAARQEAKRRERKRQAEAVRRRLAAKEAARQRQEALDRAKQEQIIAKQAKVEHRRKFVQGWREMDESQHYGHYGMRTKPVVVWLGAFLLLVGSGATLGLLPLPGLVGPAATPGVPVLLAVLAYALIYRRALSFLAMVGALLAALPIIVATVLGIYFIATMLGVYFFAFTTAQYYFLADVIIAAAIYGAFVGLEPGSAAILGSNGNSWENLVFWLCIIGGVCAIIGSYILLALAGGGGWLIVLGVLLAVMSIAAFGSIRFGLIYLWDHGKLFGNYIDDFGESLVYVTVMAALQFALLWFAVPPWFGLPHVAAFVVTAAVFAGGGLGFALSIATVRDKVPSV